MMLRYNEDEYAAVCQAAQRVGLTPTGYAALVTLAAATDKPPPRADPVRDALAELIVARLQVRRFGVNVNQAVVALHATGQAPPWLVNATALASRAVTRIDEAAMAITRSLP